VNITYHKLVDATELPAEATAETHLFCVDVDDLSGRAIEMISTINNTSWIFELGSIPRTSYETIALKTAAKLVEIFRTADGNIGAEFGEYVVSMSAGDCLGAKLGHTVLPLSELWKEQLSGNPGFDFHTESHNNRIAFGEAKYNSNQSSYTDAASQVHDFIDADKDKMDAVHLVHLASGEAMDALLDGSRGLAIAFSLHSKNHEKILANALASDFVQALCKRADELYVIGVRT